MFVLRILSRGKPFIHKYFDFIGQVRELYAQSNAFVLPTRGEGWGLPIAEVASQYLFACRDLTWPFYALILLFSAIRRMSCWIIPFSFDFCYIDFILGDGNGSASHRYKLFRSHCFCHGE